MSRRSARELLVLICTVSGTAIGYCAGEQFGATAQIACAMFGMGLCGALSDMATRR
jgi:hypothetical protein